MSLTHRRRRNRGDRRNVRIRHVLNCTVLTDRRFGRVIVPGKWKTITETREAIDRLPMSLIRTKFFN